MPDRMGPASPGSPSDSEEIAWVRVVRRGRVERVPAVEIAQRVRAAPRLLLDIGTGDGAFPYREARRDPETLCVGVDPVPEAMLGTSGRIARPRARGGVENLLLLAASLESMPSALDDTATTLTILFPWAALLRMIVLPEIEALDRIRMVCRQNADILILLNMKVLTDETQCRKLGLPIVAADDLGPRLTPAWSRCGLELLEAQPCPRGPSPLRTRWGSRLTLGSGRPVVVIRGRAS